MRFPERFSVALIVLLLTLGGAAKAQFLSLEDRGIFFESPRALVGERAWFPEARAGGDFLSVIYEEIYPADEGSGGELYISLLTSENGRSWGQNERIVGPIQYESDNPPVIFSSRVTNQGEIYVAVQSEATVTQVLRSTDGGDSFEEVARLETQVASVAPRLSLRDDGGLLLFVSQNVEGLQRILYARSEEGSSWTGFEPLAEEIQIGLHFLPTHASYQGREYVVFQSLNPEQASTYQLYVKISQDGGRTWSDARLLTEFATQTASDNYLDYDNQRPMLRDLGNALGLTWERTLGVQTRRVFFGQLGSDGTFTATPQAVSRSENDALAPETFRYQGNTYLLWFINPTGNSRIVLGMQQGNSWLRRELSPSGQQARFGSSLVDADRLHVFWQQERGAPQANRLVYLEPDQHVDPIRPNPQNYVAGRRSDQSTVQYSWQPPQDASGIEGYNYVWNRQPDTEVPRELELSASQRALQVQADEDGRWYLHFRARDRAGNWSPTTTISYFRDQTPPDRVTFPPPPVDEEGYLVSNSFTLDWNPPDAEDVAGYTYSLTRVGDPREENPESYQPTGLPRSVITESSELSRQNFDNGLWALSVAPVDRVGNVGEPNTMFLRLNKYIPVTEIFRIGVNRDVLGRYTLDVTGRGFTSNGTIERIVIDRDGRRPYDWVFRRSENAYRVLDDRRIRGLTVSDVESGSYRIGLEHSERGMTFAGRRLTFEETGRITFGDYTVRYAPSYRFELPGLFTIAAGDMVLWVVMGLMMLLAIFSSTRLVGVVREGRMLQIEARSIATGRRLPGPEQKRQVEKMRRRGIGLRFKFTLFAVLLVISVVTALAFFLSRTALERQETILARGLEERIELLLDSISARSEELLINPDNNRVELSNLVRQSQVLDEALYITITGRRRGANDYGYVWSTNDPLLTEAEPEREYVIDRQLNTENLVAGESQIQDAVTDSATTLGSDLNQEAISSLGDLPQQIEEVNNEIVTAITERGLNENSPEVQRLDQTRIELESRIRRILEDLGQVYRSYPEFNPNQLSREQTEYVFYQPALAWNPAAGAESQQYFRGTVRVGISTELILNEIARAQRDLIISTIIVAAVAVGAGVVGALLLATIVVIPINRLVRGVEVIRDTEDKSELENHVINVRSRDELSVLADTVNSMTQGLVAAAATNKELTVGKDVQKMFIPLETDESGRKMTSIREEATGVAFAGYYEGASAVSGDYFTYTRLDDRYYAIIKCDVSGHGVSAALIMVQVATLYTYFFRDWSSHRNESQALTNLVVQINDIIESMSFKGLFAAFTLSLLDTQTGEMRVCNAGDNLVNILSAETGQLSQHKLKQTPAAGVFPSDIVEMQSGFPEERIRLNSGDTALLYTDGIEESFHLLRDQDYNLHTVTAEDREQGRVPSEESNDPRAVVPIDEGQQREEFGTWRIYQVVEAVYHQQQFRLTRLFDPDNVDLLFDFSRCEPTPENMVMALMSVEKVFRLNRHPEAGPDDRVRVDTRIDEFLRSYFTQYDAYFHHPLEYSDLPEYRYFSRIREDEQEDDLTVLAIRKK
jgi:serine phosphatase RsbU (regulator of sigma subunit)